MNTVILNKLNELEKKLGDIEEKVDKLIGIVKEIRYGAQAPPYTYTAKYPMANIDTTACPQPEH